MFHAKEWDLERKYGWGNEFACCYGDGDCKSDIVDMNRGTHWFVFKDIGPVKSNTPIYFSISVNYKTGCINLYWMDESGTLIHRNTTCSTEYLNVGKELMKNASFCVGTYIGGVDQHVSYCKLNMYACRLYSRILEPTEVEGNFNESINYHKYLMEN